MPVVNFGNSEDVIPASNSAFAIMLNNLLPYLSKIGIDESNGDGFSCFIHPLAAELSFLA